MVDKDTARHAVSMDQVLMSVKKTFADDEPSANVREEISRSAAPLPDSIRAQQQRLSTLHTRRTKLPPLPSALKERETADATRVPPSMHADVPQVVEINAVGARAAGSIEPTYRWGNHQLRERTADAEAYGLDLAAQAMPHATDTDWDSLKSDLQAVVDQWVERQKQVQR